MYQCGKVGKFIKTTRLYCMYVLYVYILFFNNIQYSTSLLNGNRLVASVLLIYALQVALYE